MGGTAAKEGPRSQAWGLRGAVGEWQGGKRLAGEVLFLEHVLHGALLPVPRFCSPSVQPRTCFPVADDVICHLFVYSLRAACARRIPPSSQRGGVFVYQCVCSLRPCATAPHGWGMGCVSAPRPAGGRSARGPRCVQGGYRSRPGFARCSPKRPLVTHERGLRHQEPGFKSELSQRVTLANFLYLNRSLYFLILQNQDACHGSSQPTRCHLVNESEPAALAEAESPSQTLPMPPVPILHQ